MSYAVLPLSIPRVQTIDDVLRLRGDSRIRHFRSKIFEWSERLRTGELSSEEAIRSEIKEANAAIEDIGKYRKIGMWLTFLSVPLTVAEMLIGLPVSAIIATPIGIAAEVASLAKEKQYSWLLFGS